MKGETMNKTVILICDDETVALVDDEGYPVAEMDWTNEEDFDFAIWQVVKAFGLEFVGMGEPEGVSFGWQIEVTVKP